MKMLTDAEFERLVAERVARALDEVILLEGPEGRAAWITTRRLEIAAILAEWKREYFVDGIERPMADRATLEAEAADLALEKRRLGAQTVIAQAARRNLQERQLSRALMRLLEDRGMHDLIEEAKASICELVESPGG